MASRKSNPSRTPLPKDLNLAEARIAVITSEWNNDITSGMLVGCMRVLKDAGIRKKHLFEYSVPGSFELPSAARLVVESRKLDAVICLGCIIKGETRHDEYISQAVAKGIMDLNLRYNIPFIFGVLTTESAEQARERAGGRFGNKGAEAAATAVRMILLKQNLRK